MVVGAVILLLGCLICILFLPKNFCIIALLIGTFFMTMGQRIDLGAITLHFDRILLLAGLIRIISRGQTFTPGGINTTDKLVIAFAAWVSFAGMFESNGETRTIYSLGIAYSYFAAYFIFRAVINTPKDLEIIYRTVSIFLIVLSVFMLLEKTTGRNAFSIFGGVSEFTASRGGKLRAQGAFSHPIIAGSMGAIFFPFCLQMRKRSHSLFVISSISCLVIVFCSASSGPILSFGAVIFALYFWTKRQWTKRLFWSCVGLYVMLDLVTERPFYYQVSKIDITGGSTGYHRARLIDTTINHFDEWWATGTTYTRHWMPYGLPNVPNHCDITNYFIAIGVLAGFAGMLFVIFIIRATFRAIGSKCEQLVRSGNSEMAFKLWCNGSALFCFVVTGMSVAYFDQSRTLLWMTIAITTSAISTLQNIQPDEDHLEATDASRSI